jgi:uncharacterized protein
MPKEAPSFEPHPEGGRFHRIWEAELRLPASALPADYGGPRSAGTCIAYVLEPGERSRWHRVRSAELWLWQGGGVLRLTTGGTGPEPGPGATIGLGPGPGDVLAHAVEPLEWQCAEPVDGRAVRVACVVVPGFDWRDWAEGPDGSSDLPVSGTGPAPSPGTSEP